MQGNKLSSSSCYMCVRACMCAWVFTHTKSSPSFLCFIWSSSLIPSAKDTHCLVKSLSPTPKCEAQSVTEKERHHCRTAQTVQREFISTQSSSCRFTKAQVTASPRRFVPQGSQSGSKDQSHNAIYKVKGICEI